MNNPLQTFDCYVEKDSLEFNSKQELERFKHYLTHKKSKSKPRTEFKLTVKRKRKQRTSKQPNEKSNQNGYYWGVVIMTLINSDPFIGHHQDDMNYGLKCKFLRVGGSEAFPQTISFSDLSKKDFELKMEEIRIWALTEYKITIQSVQEYYEEPEYVEIN